MAKVALTVWNGRISPVFDVCREALILDLDDRKILSTSRAALDSATPQLKVERLVALGVETLVCGAISEPLRRELGARGMTVLGFVAGPIEEVVQALLADALPAPGLSMPGCRGRRRRFRGGRDRGRGPAGLRNRARLRPVRPRTGGQKEPS